VNPAILAFARRDAELIAVGKQGGKPSTPQSEINRLLVEHVAAGRRVCRLKGGDPMVFGRVGEELDALAEAGLPFQIVPGVSAVEGCSAYAGIPLTLRDESQAILIATGHTREHVESDLSGFQARQTLALYMSIRRIGDVSSKLLELGHSSKLPAAIIEHGTTDRQRVIMTTLGSLAAAAERHAIGSPALVLIGHTTRHAKRFAWFGAGPVTDGDDGGGQAQVS
jgi:uroporphyrin-III C-methyltransferase/precorrin-2 dehydrogenase/sirohydrochlorin ferrochelatase